MTASDEVLVAVGRLYGAVQRFATLDTMFAETWPEPSLGPAVLGEVEAALKHALPDTLHAYYTRYDRWNGFRYDNVILSVRALSDGSDWVTASERFAQVEAIDFGRSGRDKSDWLVFAFNRYDIDLYLVHRRTGEVLWWAGEVVDRFDSVAQFLHVNASFLEQEAERLSGVHDA